ncbi:carboxylesterase/lipase family protein [Haliea sp. E17]|uniref:carboxylesterase/lipase family protein n=1 Tax=Haliea sp. E17 TaxID=3401576 RepID=UPI003AAF29CF
MKLLFKLPVLIAFSGFVALQGCKGQDKPRITTEVETTAVEAAVPAPASFVQVATTEGEVQGISQDGLIEFKGIPYAAPPVGDLRWRAPQAPAARDSLLVADTYGNRCWQRPVMENGFQQKEAFTQPENEDCLYLNIYRPASADAKLPVMVWIHGGGLVSGSGSRPVNYGGKLAAHGAVVVAFNYRLGSFGFFAHPELSAENADEGRLFNYGLMDQIAALKWVQANIAAFGGDPQRVTIFGESAGGASVYALAGSPAAKGLFSGAIAQSGYGRGRQPRVASLAAAEDVVVESVGQGIAERAGNPEATLADLRALGAEQIVAATDFGGFISFAVDGQVITEDLGQSFASGRAAAVPMIIGATDSEFTMGPPEAIRGALLASSKLTMDMVESMTTYYGDEAKRDTYMYSDYVFHGVNRALTLAHEAQGQKVYNYRFAMPGAMSKPGELNGEKVYGAFHASDMPYTFGNFTGDHMEPKEPDARQLEVSEQVMSYWVNFATNGNPNGEGLPQWPESAGEYTMQFNPDVTEARKDVWNVRLDALNDLLK